MNKLLKLNSRGKRLFLLVLFLTLFGLILRLLFVWKHSTAFTYDQARDLLDLREMWLLRKPRLIGSNTSLHGVFYGPFWYWLCFPFYLLTGGHPMTNLIPLMAISLFLPLIIFWVLVDKRLGFILATVYIFSHSFFVHSVVALNTNPVIFFTPLFLVFLAKYFQKEKQLFLWLIMFLMAVLFHFEPLIGIFWILIFLTLTLFFGKMGSALKSKKAAVFFLIPFLPQVVFEFRHNFLQTRAFLSLISGGGSSLTPAEGNLSFRFFERLGIFTRGWQERSGSLVLAVFFLALVVTLILRLFRSKQLQKEADMLLIICLFSLVIIFIGFVIYPFALWPWYLSVIDALMLTLIGLGIYFLFTQSRRYFYLPLGLLAIFLLFSVFQYLPWPLKQGFSSDPANLRTRLEIVDLVYNDAQEKGMNIFTFAPYVYDYPYQYLIWWRAKTKYGYLPGEYFYLTNQPPYVPAKEKADGLIPVKKAECDYLIIEPFESQEEWFWDWRYRFPEAQKTWEIGRTRVEKLCQD